MLPFLIGGLVLGVGKLVYDAVTDTSSSPSSTSSGPSEEEVKEARKNERRRKREAMTKELLESTATNVSNLLEMHKGLVSGQAKSPKSMQSISDVLNPQTAWPFPTGGGSKKESRDDEDTQIRASVLSEYDLRKATILSSKASGLDILTPLTDGLSYKDSHAKEQLKTKCMATKRDALRELSESL